MYNRRRSLVINKQFQYQYSLLAVALTVLLVNIAIIIQALLPTEEPLIMTNAMALGLATIEFLLISGVWFGSLKATHKIAGPIFVFAREIDKLGRGDLTASINLRQSDMFQDVAYDMNASLAKLRGKISTIKQLAEQLQQAQSNQQQAQELLQAITQELSALNTEGVKQRPDPDRQPIADRGQEQCLVQ